MQTTEIRRKSERGRLRSLPGDRLWRYAAIGLLILAVSAGWAVLSRDTGWELRSRAARAHGDTANRNGRYGDARLSYEAALRDDPYDWNTHLALADILAHKLNDPLSALRHYTYALAYSANPAIVDPARHEIAILGLLRSGELENPRDAAEDMFLAAGAAAKDAFAARLSPALAPHAEEFFEAWRTRGRGTVAGMRISSGADGFYDAALEVDFPGGTTMLMHLRAALRDVWRLDVSMP